MPQSMALITNALKDDYSPGLRNALNNMNVIWGEVSRNTEDIIGEQAHWAVQSGRSNSTGARAEFGVLPTADRQRYLKALDKLKFMYHTIKVSGPAKALTRGSEGAFVKAVESEVKGAERDIKLDMNRQSFGQKVSAPALVSGVIATLSADPGAGAVWTFANEPSSVIRHFFVGMQFAVVIPGTGATREGVYEVQSISVSAKTVTTTQAAHANVATGEFIVRVSGTTQNTTAPAVNTTNLDNEINGLRFLVGTQDYAGITAASNPSWNALALGSSATAISEVILDQAVEIVETDGNGSTPSLYITEHAQRRKLASLLQAQKRYDGRELTLTSGWKGLDVARGALVVDRFAPSNTVFCLTPAEIELFVGLDFQWDEDDDGGVFYKALDGTDAIEARYKWYGNLESPTRNCHSVVTLAEPTF